MEEIVHDPVSGIYPSTEDYVHALEVRGAGRMLFVSGTMGLDVDGVAGATLEAQLELIWGNIGTILASAGMDISNIARITSYMRKAEYAAANEAARLAALGARRVPTTALVAETLSPDWLVEIEVIAVA
ncbi:MAG: RidA family protein [Pseudomonadota bacterium]